MKTSEDQAQGFEIFLEGRLLPGSDSDFAPRISRNLDR